MGGTVEDSDSELQRGPGRARRWKIGFLIGAIASAPLLYSLTLEYGVSRFLVIGAAGYILGFANSLEEGRHSGTGSIKAANRFGWALAVLCEFVFFVVPQLFVYLRNEFF